MKKNLWLYFFSIIVQLYAHAQSAGIITNGALIIVPSSTELIIPGNVKISGGSDSILNNGIVIMSANFSNNGKSFCVSGLGTEIFNGTSVISGTINSTFNNLVINPGASVTLAKGIDVKNDWTNNGIFIHGNKQVTFSGSSSTQNLFGTATFYDLVLQNAVNFGSSKDSIDHNFSNSVGGMLGGTSRVVFKNGSSLIGTASKNFYDFEILNAAVVNHLTSGGTVHVANSFINNGIFTENAAYTFYFDKSGATNEIMSGSGTTTFGKLAIGDGSNYSFATTLNCSADFTVAGGSISFYKGSVYNGINNTALFTTNACIISGAGTANFYNATTNTSLNAGNGISNINNNLTINTGGSLITNSPFYNSSATLIYNTANSSFNTGAEWTGNTAAAGIGSPYNILIQNANNIIMSGSRTVPGVLTVTAGNSLNLNGNILTINSSYSGTGNLTGSVASGLIINNNAGTIYFTPDVYPGGSTNNYLRTLLLNGSSANATIGDSLNITAGTSGNYGTVTVTGGTLNANGVLTLKSDANGTARVGVSTGTITGKVTVERYMPPLRAWRFLTVPFSSSTQTVHDSWQEGVNNYGLGASFNQNPHPGYGTHITGNNYSNLGYDYNTTYNPSYKVWDSANNTWNASEPPTISTGITDYPAYCIFVRGSRAVDLSLATAAPADQTVLRATGKLNQNGSAYSKTYTGSAGNMLLVGNPYASSIDLTNILTGSTGINSNVFWVWDPKRIGTNNVGGYVAYSNGVISPSPSPSYPDANSAKIIESGQAFMVQLSGGSSSAAMNFTESDKIATENNVFGNIQSNQQQQQAPPVIYTNLMVPTATGGLFLADGVATGFGSQYSAAVDGNDATKLWNFDENIAQVRDGKTLAIEFRPLPALTDTLFYRLYLRQKPYVLKIFTQNFQNINARAWIVDKYLNTKTEVNLHDTTLYSFTPNTDTNSYRNRFMLVFNKQYSAIAVPVTKAVNQNNPDETGSANSLAATATGAGAVTVYPNPVSTQKVMLRFNGMDKGSYEITVYSPKGEKLASHKIDHNGSNNIYPLALNASWVNGVYTICIKTSNSKKRINLTFLIIKES